MSQPPQSPYPKEPEMTDAEVTDEVQVSVTRVITFKYRVPISSYNAMTRDEIREWERKSVDDPGMLLDDIDSEDVTVTFSDEADR